MMDRPFERVAEQQRALADLGQRALARVVLPVVMQDAVETAARLLDVEHVTVLELAPDSDLLRLRAGVGWQQGAIGATVDAMEGGYVAYTLHAQDPVVVRELAAETRFVPARLLLDQGVVSSCAVRIMGAGARPYGVLGVHATRSREFGEDDVAFLRGVAAVVATAIARHRQALTLNDTILQHLVVARYRLEANDHDGAVAAVHEALQTAQGLVSGLLGDDDAGGQDPLPGDLRR